MDNKSAKPVYVSVGHPALPNPYVHRLRVILEMDDEKLARLAGKKVRSLIAERQHELGFHKNLKLKSSDFYFVVFPTMNGDEKPITASDNYYWKFGVRKEYGDPSPETMPFYPKFIGPNLLITK